MVHKLSPKRIEWLRMLAAADGPLKCPFVGTVGYGARKMGWTEWAMISPEGEVLRRSEVESRLGKDWLAAYKDGYRIAHPDMEYITEAGRKALAGAE